MRGITRYASLHLPMDETLTRVALDISGRPFLVFRTEFAVAKIGAFDTELVREFFQAFAINAGLTLHVETLYGANAHHIAESCFKGLARALRAAVAIDPAAAGEIPPPRAASAAEGEDIMAVWTVFEPDEAKDGAAPTLAQWAERVVFVREKFSWLSILFAPLVLLRHRLWLALIVYIALQVLIGFAHRCAGTRRARRPAVPAAELAGGVDAVGPAPRQAQPGAAMRSLARWWRPTRDPPSGASSRAGFPPLPTAAARHRLQRPAAGAHRPGLDGAESGAGAVSGGARAMSGGNVVLIDYGSGNLHSAGKALERAARESGTGQPILVTSDPEAVRTAERVVLPGVGAYADCRRGLDAVPGMVDALTEAVREKGRPFLGICVGLQLMATRGLEHGVTNGLDWIPGDVVKLAPDDASLKIPHMGWNSLEARRAHHAAGRHTHRRCRARRLFRALLPPGGGWTTPTSWR